MTPDYTTWPAIVSALEEERDAYKDAAQRNGQAADDWERAYRLARRERFTLADDLLQVQDLVRTFWRSCRGTTDPGTLAHLVERCRRLDWLEEEEPDEEGGAFASGHAPSPTACAGEVCLDDVIRRPSPSSTGFIPRMPV